MRTLLVLGACALLLGETAFGAGGDKLEKGRALLASGDLEGARHAAAGAGVDGQVLLAEVHRVTGHHAEARALLEGIVKKQPKHLRARALLGIVYEETGEKKLADAVWNKFFDESDAGKLEEKAEPLTYLGIAARYLEDFRGAKDVLQDAFRQDPKYVPAMVESGWLFLSKYNAADAESWFEDALKVEPDNPDAHAGMARVKLEQGYDVTGAEEHLKKALARNPAHARALLIRAETYVDNGDYAVARKTLAPLLAVNPDDVGAHSLLAAMHWLEDDLPAYEAEKKKVFARNPLWAPFFHTVADFAVKEHRYKEAIALEEEGLKIDPKYWTGLAAIGIGYLRLGDEANGMKNLLAAFRGDKYNARTYNYLNLFERTIPESYEMIAPVQPPGVFRFRVPKDESALIERYLPQALGRAWKDMVQRYGFTPATPTTFELFNDPDDYSVRTVGLPNLGALAVCFGQVVTGLSPSNGNVNWGMILWHELGHVFAIQLSNSRVPRWYTEGLSEYETLIARPEWRRENDIDVWLAMRAGKLPSVVELNTRFLRARDMNEMVAAYHLSSVTIEFIAKRWGFPKLVEGLRLFGKGKDTGDVITAITGLAIPAFDAELRKHLEQRLAVYKGTFKIVLSDYDDLTALEKAAAAKPGDAAAQAELAVGWLAEENGDKAQAAAQAALAIDGKNQKALYVLGEIAAEKGDADGATARYRALIAAGGDGYDVRMRLARLAREAGDLKQAEAELAAAKKLDPERSDPYLILTELYSKTNREDQSLAELERYVMLEQMEYPPLKKLIDRHAAKKNWAKVRQFGEMALFLNPFDADLHMVLGEAYAQTGAPDPSIYEFDSALKAEPPLRRPAVARLGLARAYLAKKDPALARRAVEEALKLEPENAEALELAKKIRPSR